MGKYSPRCGLILFCRVCLSAAAFANALRMPAVLVLVFVLCCACACACACAVLCRFTTGCLETGGRGGVGI